MNARTVGHVDTRFHLSEHAIMYMSTPLETPVTPVNTDPVELHLDLIRF